MNNEQQQLEAVRDWAKEKIESGKEPPWAWFQYMKLVETLDTILCGRASVITRENSQIFTKHKAVNLQLVYDKYQKKDATSHNDIFDPPCLPI